MCYKAREGNQTDSGLIANTSYVKWGIDNDGRLLQVYYGPLEAEINCICVANQTLAKLERYPPWPVKFIFFKYFLIIN